MVNKRITTVNKSKKQDVYKSTTKVNDKKATVNKSNTKINKEKSYKLTTKVNKEKQPVVNKSNTIVNEAKELVVYKDITKVSTKVKTDILEVAALKGKIQEVINWYEAKHKNVIETPELKMDKKHFTGEIVVKSYRLHSDIVKRFDSFANKHNQYKMQDLISQALLEFVEKYH